MGPKYGGFLLNFTRILWPFWDLVLTLFGISKDLVFAEILVFSIIFRFPALNWTLKCTKTVNVGCVPFEPKWTILKDFSITMFVLLETSSGQNFRRSNNIWGSRSPKIPQKRPFHECWMSSLVKISNKIGNILGSTGQKNTQKQPKMTVSASTKTFANLKLENYRSDINETCPVCVPP